MNSALQKPPPYPPSPPSPDRNASGDAQTWRDAAFWSLLLAGLGAGVVLAALDNPAIRQVLLALTTHAQSPGTVPAAKAAFLIEHIRWWLIALPLAALVVRWAPLPIPRGSGKQSPGTHPAQSLPSDEPSPGRASSSSPLPVPPMLVGVFALQLILGAGFLTGTWAYIRDQFWFPKPASDNEIRDQFLSRRTMSLVRRLDRVLPSNADVYLLADYDATPSFLSYYLCPRRLFSPEGPAGFLEQADSAGFWSAPTA